MGWLGRLWNRVVWGVAGGEASNAQPERRRSDLLDVAELARRLDVTVDELARVPVKYREFTVPKRSGGTRRLAAPAPALRRVQRLILRWLLARLRTHEAAMGFQPGRSFVHHAAWHAGQAVVIRIDIMDFFPSTSAQRIAAYFRWIGWDPKATKLLTHLCTWNGSLPQGAPTSPRLSNLVNVQLDARCQGLADALGARYSRYADDLTFSFAEDDRERIGYLLYKVRTILEESGYRMHMKRKLHIRRRHQRQEVTGLVVNGGPARLPRRIRRWLRAVEHHLATGQPTSLTPTQIQGWRALADMVQQQGGDTLTNDRSSREP